jgi:hypothetical protein
MFMMFKSIDNIFELNKLLDDYKVDPTSLKTHNLTLNSIKFDVLDDTLSLYSYFYWICANKALDKFQVSSYKSSNYYVEDMKTIRRIMHTCKSITLDELKLQTPEFNDFVKIFTDANIRLLKKLKNHIIYKR